MLFAITVRVLVGHHVLTLVQFISQIFLEQRPLDQVGVGMVARVFETVGLSVFLTWWGTRTNPFD